MPTDKPQPWDRLVTEGDAAYAAFLVYRNLGPTRSLSVAYAMHTKSKPGEKQVGGSWRKWCAANRWPERSAAWDDRGRRVADRAVERVIATDAAQQARLDLQRLRDRQVLRDIRMGNMMRRRAAEHFRAVPGQSMETRDALTAARLASQMIRIALGMPTKVEQVEVADAADGLYDTSGQLASELPDGAVPEMPAEVNVKPDLSSVADAAENGASKPDPKSRERPG